jgi:ABC-type dipeptide/oligopeptide/nickel transport system permease subunit
VSAQAVGSPGLAPLQREIETPAERFRRRFLRQRPAVVSLVVLLLITVVAIGSPVLAPQNPNIQDILNRLQGPSGAHLLGTDDLGRDELSRLMYASRVSLWAGLEATLISLLLGVPLGLVAGYEHGWLDASVSRVADVVQTIPGILLALGIIGMLGPNLTNAMVAIGIVYSPSFYRVARAAAMSVREETYIEAARSLGGTSGWILLSHVLPNVLSPLLVRVSLTLGFCVLAEAAISFLGLGVQPPDASWGTMLGRSTTFMERAPWLVTIPGLMIFVTVLALNTLGDGIRDSIGREVRE